LANKTNNMKQTDDNKLEIYTDGSCLGNPGPGGYGAVLRRADGRVKEISGAVQEETTNNRMELTAVIMGLKELKRACSVRIGTDSQYVLKGASEWLEGWKRRNWKTASKAPVLNRDLWQQIDELVQTHEVSWEWIRGHSGHAENEKADSLANQGIDELALDGSGAG